jgi:hypothetical protein
MAARWSFFAFDWERFRQIRPKLKLASEAADFTALDWPDAMDLFEHIDEAMRPEEISNQLITTMCAVDDPVYVEGGLPATILKLRRLPNGEEPGDLLAELISAEPGIEDWFRTESGMVGVLSAPTTEELAHLVGPFDLNGEERPARGVAQLARKLAVTDTPKDPLQSLIDLVKRATQRGCGVAAFKE